MTDTIRDHYQAGIKDEAMLLSTVTRIVDATEPPLTAAKSTFLRVISNSPGLSPDPSRHPANAAATEIAPPMSRPEGAAAVVQLPVPSSQGPMSEALLRTVAESVAQRLRPEDRAAIIGATSPGLVPGTVDRQLLGTAKNMLNTILPEAEKRLLRRILYDLCKSGHAAS